MSKIQLIKPRFLSQDFQTITHPMGLMYIGAELKQAGHGPKINDCRRDSSNLHLLKRKITGWEPDLIGIGIIITDFEHTRRIMMVIREIPPDVPVTFDGPWPSANSQGAIRNFGDNFFVLDEGELAFPGLIDAINNGHPTESISGTVSMVKGHLKVNAGMQLTEEELNAAGQRNLI